MILLESEIAAIEYKMSLTLFPVQNVSQLYKYVVYTICKYYKIKTLWSTCQAGCFKVLDMALKTII